MVDIYIDMAHDAGYTGEEAQEMAQVLYWEEQEAYARWQEEQEYFDRLDKKRQEGENN